MNADELEAMKAGWFLLTCYFFAASLLRKCKLK